MSSGTRSKKLPKRLITQKFDGLVGKSTPIKKAASKEPPRVSPTIIIALLVIIVGSSIVAGYNMMKAPAF